MVLAELITYYAAQVPGLTASTNIFYGEMKEWYPDFVVLLREFTGLATEPNMGDPAATPGKTPRIENPSVSVMVRGVKDDYDTPYNTAYLIYLASMKIVNSTLSGVKYLSADASLPNQLGHDDNFRQRFTVNLNIMKEPS
jgi:hypothetical protein